MEDLSEIIGDPEETFDLESLLSEAEQRAHDEEISLVDAFESVLSDRGSWAVDDASSAEWAMGKVSAASERVRVASAQAEVWMNKISEWLIAETKRDRATIEFMSAHLERYAIEQRRLSDGRTKTINLPSGKITTARPKTESVIVADEKAVLEWGATLDRAVGDAMTSRKVRLTELRSFVHITEAGVVASLDGERVPGAKVQELRTTAKVVPAT